MEKFLFSTLTDFITQIRRQKVAFHPLLIALLRTPIIRHIPSGHETHVYVDTEEGSEKTNDPKERHERTEYIQNSEKWSAIIFNNLL